MWASAYWYWYWYWYCYWDIDAKGDSGAMHAPQNTGYFIDQLTLLLGYR